MTDEMEPAQADDVASAETGRRPSVPLRVLLGVLLVAGMVCGWGMMGRQKTLKQVEAIQAIQQIEGDVYYSYQWSQGKLLPDAQPPQPQWLRRLVGPAAFDHAVAVDLRGVHEVDQALPWLLLLSSLTDVNLSNTSAADDSLHIISRLAGLSQLDLSGTAVTDEGIAPLTRLRQLTSLSLARTIVSDHTLETLARMKQLRHLDLSATHVSEQGIARLRQELPKCRIIS